MASFGSIALCLHWHWLLRCHNNKGDSKTADSRNLEVIGRVQFPVQHQPQHCQWQQKVYKFQQRKVQSFMTNINCIFPGTLRPWCNDNCPFITLWQKHAVNTILRSNIWQKLTLFYSDHQRGSEKVPDTPWRPSVKFFTKCSLADPSVLQCAEYAPARA